MNKTVIFLFFLALVVLAEPSQDELKNQQQELSMKRTACLVLSRYHSNTQKESIESVISALTPDLQQKYINKLYAKAIEHCMPVITMDEAQKFFVQDPNFSPEEMFYIFENFDYGNIAADIETLTKNQENLIKFIKNFDEEMQVRREERQATKEQLDGEDKFDMKFFGISRDQVPSSAKYVYITIFVVIVGGSIFYLMSKLGDDKDKKQKASRKKSKSPGKTTQSQPATTTTAAASPSKQSGSPSKQVKKQ